MERCFYINLDSRPDRRKQMEGELRKAGIADITTRVAALTPRHPEVAAIAQEFPGKSAGYHANAASHAEVWELIAADPDENAMTLIMEDDVVLHTQWKSLLQAALSSIYSNGRGPSSSDSCSAGVRANGRATEAESVDERQPPQLDCLLLDGLYVTGEISAEYGWLGPPSEGPHRAECVAFSSAYMLTPAAARWLVSRRSERPGSSTEAYLMQLQEERGASWTHLPRLALQRWDELASSVAGSGGASNMRKWYEDNYFVRFPWTLYCDHE